MPLPEKQWVVKAFVILVILVNLVILCLAWADRSWGAFFMAVVWGPIANGVLLLVGLLATVFRKRMGWRTSMIRGLPMALLPIFAISLDVWIIMNMGLSGC
ncbi:hypothetical protein [Roseimicrobium sp. ORNL1]|uniref:hypothetical protein n=1 Tax=Roseimicrobium sp. ORNL1 TaxID=2711231 RepID=UPI0013E1A940|nr:hypothetical protein [Roseimicrobium sp. ORNL1]QIF02138.1 hypothetical protein G5S37_11535 [Roseimicrobium sp. ORNL1]